MDTNRLNGHSALVDDQEEEKPKTQRLATTVLLNQKFKIPGDVIARTCESLPDEQRHAIKWAAGFCRERNITPEEFGGMLSQPGSGDKPYSGDSVYAAFTGRREQGSLERFCKSVHTLRKRLEETAARTDTLFVETSLSKSIFKACRTAFEKKRVVFIFGETQIGKTRSLNEYARRHNHGETILVRMPTGGRLGEFMAELALRLGIGTNNKKADLRRRILESFDDRTLLIVDECEECVSGNDRSLASLTFAREIYDRRKCGLVLSGALNFRNTLRTSYTLKKLWLRGYRPLQLPARPGRADLEQFASAFGLTPAEDKTIGVNLSTTDGEGNEVTERILGNPLALQTQVIKDYGLGRWLTLLEDAADMAKENNTRISWGRVITANALIVAVENGEGL